MKRWAADHGVGSVVAMARGNALAALGVDEVPSTVFVRRGRIVGVASGPVGGRWLLRHAGDLVDSTVALLE